MILVDTAPLVALFDPKDSRHERCRRVLKKVREPLRTTVPVLTEAFHMLRPPRDRFANVAICSYNSLHDIHWYS
jgi:hypothetical protein